MKRIFSDEELEKLFTGVFAEMDMEQMMDKISRDQSSLAYLELLGDQEASSYLPEDEDNKLFIKDFSRHPGARKMIAKLKDALLPPIPKGVPESPGFGQIFGTELPLNWPFPQQETRVVLVMSNEEGSNYSNAASSSIEHSIVQVAPISFDLAGGMNTDIKIKASDSPFNVPYLVRISNLQPMYTRQLAYYYGTLDAKYFAVLGNSWKRMAGIRKKRNSSKDHSGRGEYYKGIHHSESEITRYMREPVQRMIYFNESFLDLQTFDLSYLLDIKVLNKEKMVLEEIRRLLVSKQDYIARLAADALDMAAIVQSTKNSRYKIIEDDDFVLFVVCRADGLYFWLHATGPDTTIEIRLFDQHHRECLIFENVQINYENQDFMIRLFALDVLNKTIILELKTRYKLLTRKIRFCHGYSE